MNIAITDAVREALEGPLQDLNRTMEDFGEFNGLTGFVAARVVC